MAPSLPPRPKSSPEIRFSNLRSVQWRIHLGILPSSPSSSTEDYRRGAADSRRRYASLRRRLLVDPHLPKDGNKPIDPAMDNPLSQNPDSMWGRFFRNAELERMLDQDLSRLYPEHGSYFQSSACQAMLRRVLLVWCLRHTEYGYRQGMHELLAPLLYVLHVDILRHSEVRKKHEDHFTDEFDDACFPESDVTSNYRFTKKTDWNDSSEGAQGMATRASSLDELDPETRDIILLSDAYGAEGELGVLLSDRFMEHDAYCMFDALMNGSHGIVTMADFFSPSPPVGSSTILPPVIEAASALYHLLSIVDSSLHAHLVELGVEPHYFAMRWLRVLFGREFSLKDLLLVWDEVFSCPNTMSQLENDVHQHFKVLSSRRGALISAMAVAMILHLRSALLATENATSCLQKLLNFPENIDVKKLIGKAKSLQALAFDTYGPRSPSQVPDQKVKSPRLSHSLSLGSSSPKTSLYALPESYWEKKWRVMHKDEEVPVSTPVEEKKKPVSNGFIKRLHTERFGLFRTDSDPSPAKNMTAKKESRLAVKRNLLEDLSREVDDSESKKAQDTSDVASQTTGETPAKDDHDDPHVECISEKSLESKAEVASSVGENSSCISTASSPVSEVTDHDNDLEEAHTISKSLTSDYHDGGSSAESKVVYSCSDPGAALSSTKPVLGKEPDTTGSHEAVSKEKKAPPSKFQWFWKFGKNAAETNAQKGSQKTEISGNPVDKTEVAEKNVMGSLKNLGTSMLENVQVLESVFQQDLGQSGSLENMSSNIFGGKGQVTAMAALRELRKISSLLTEM